MHGWELAIKVPRHGTWWLHQIHITSHCVFLDSRARAASPVEAPGVALFKVEGAGEVSSRIDCTTNKTRTTLAMKTAVKAAQVVSPANQKITL
jgi:hypothetical protein